MAEPLFSYTITTDPDVNEAIAEAVARFPLGVPSMLRKVINGPLGEELLAALRDRKPVRYPIEWQSEKQRRAFFATDGFGKGIPYRRTNALPEGWRLSVDEMGRMNVTNTQAHALYVQSEQGIQLMHIGTYNIVEEEVEKRAIAFTEGAIDAYLWSEGITNASE